MSTKVRQFIAFVGAVLVVALLIALFRLLQHWLAFHTGTLHGGPDVYYNFWSGFGSDLGEATLIVTIVTATGGAYRHHNCHVKGCPWLGKPVAGTPYICCPKHHPAHEGTKRGVTMETIHKAHEKAKVVCEDPSHRQSQ